MKDEKKTKKQLLNELVELRQRLAELEDLDNERARIEDTLKQAEQEKRTILDSLVEHVVYHDMEMKVLWANRAACESVAMTREELLGRHCYEIWAKRSDPCEDCPVRSARETGQPQAVEKTKPDGRTLYIQGSPVRNSNGDIVGMVELALEISERKRAKEALRESEARYRVLVDNLHEGIWVIDKDAHTTFVNPRMAEMVGYTVDEMQGKHLFAFMDEGWVEICRHHLERRKQGIKERHDFQFLRKDGARIYASLETSPLTDDDGNYIGAIAGVQDITEHKQLEEALWKAHDELEQRVEKRTVELMRVNQQLKLEIQERKRVEEALLESEHYFRSLLINMREDILVIDRDYRITDVNNAFLQTLGRKREEVIGHFCYEASHGYKQPCDSKGEECMLRQVFETGEPHGYRHKHTSADGSRVWVDILLSPLTDEQGNVIHVIEAVRDVTDLIEVKEALREREERLRAIFEAAENVSLIMTDLAGEEAHILEFSPGAERIFGYPREEVIGKSVAILHLPEDVSKFPEVIESMRQRKAGFTGESTLVRKSGEKFPALFTTYPIFDAEGNMTATLGVSIDITERKRAEEELRTYQVQLRSLVSELLFTEERERRRLATDLHDSIGQILAISKIKLDALRNAAPSAPVTGDLDKVRELTREAIQQTRSLTYDLSPPALYQLGLEAALESLVERMEELHGIRVDLTDDKQPKPLSEDLAVLLFRSVQELLLNILKHAQTRDARVSIGRDGDEVRITVADDGIGFDISEIDSHVDREKKFGLFSISERLDHLGGHFEIASKPSQGTQVILLAPLQSDR